MKSRSIQTLTTLFLLFFLFQSNAQSQFDRSHRSDFPHKVSLGFNIVDDTFKNADGFDAATEINMVPFPSRLSVEGILYEYLSWEGAFSYNKYEAGHVVNGGEIKKDWDYYSYDANLKFYFGDFLNTPEIFDPYINGGLSHIRLNDKSGNSLAFGGGFNIWPFVNDNDFIHRDRAIDQLGFFLQGQGKVQLKQPGNADSEKHIQIAFGAIYQF